MDAESLRRYPRNALILLLCVNIVFLLVEVTVFTVFLWVPAMVFCHEELAARLLRAGLVDTRLSRRLGYVLLLLHH